MALNKTQLESVNQSNFPNNNAQLITPALLREFNTDVIASLQLQDTAATTGSNTFKGNQIVSGNVDITGTLTAYEIHTIIESSSIIYSSGSNQLGDALSDTQILSGSVFIVGSGSLNGNRILTTADTASLTFNTSSLVTTASFNAYTQSTNLRLNSLETTSQSLNQFTASQIVSNSYFATTGSNSFTGNQSIAKEYHLNTNGIYWNDSTAGYNNLEIINSAYGNVDISAINGRVRVINSPLFLTGSAITSSNDISTSANIYAANLTGSGGSIPAGTVSSSAQIVAYNIFATTSSVTASINTLSASVYQTDATQSFQITANALTASNSTTALSQSLYFTDTTQSVNITQASASAWGAFQSASAYSASAYAVNVSQSQQISASFATSSAYSASLAASITGSSANVTALSSSIYLTDSTQSNNIASNSSSFATSISASNFNITNNSASVAVTINNLSSSIYQTDSTQSNNIASNSSSIGLLQTFSASSDSRYVQNSQTASMSVATASVALAISTSISTQNLQHFVTFVDNSTGKQTVQVDGGLKYNPNQDLLLVTNITSSGYISASAIFVNGQSVATSQSVTDLSASVYQTDATQSNNISTNTTNITTLTSKTGSYATTGSNTFTGSQTILSGSIAVLNNGNVASLNETEINVETYTSDAYGIIAANNHSASMGIISWDGATYDNELWIQADNSGIQLTDWDNGTGNISAVPFLSIGANTGSQPAPIFNRGLVTHKEIKGTGSINLQPDQTDARFIEIYNTAATDTHITASGGNLFLGNDETFVLVTTYANQKELTLRGDAGIHISGSITSSNDISSSGNLIVNTITASAAQITYLHTIYESSSVVYSSGSNQLGDELTDTQILSGSVKVVGGLTLNGVSVSTQSVDISALNAFTASQIVSNSYFATTSSVNDLSASIYQTDATQSNNISSNSSSIGLLQTFSGSQYKNDSSSFDSRIIAATGSTIYTGSFATTGSNTFSGSQIIRSTGGAPLIVDHYDATPTQNTLIGFNKSGSAVWSIGNLGSDDSFILYNPTTFQSPISVAQNNNVTFLGNITASGTIFSSGSITASYLKIVDLITANSINTNFLSSSTYVLTNNITASGNISSSTISGLGNATLFSSSVNSRLIAATGSTIYTGSFAITSSNTFTGNQTIYGGIVSNTNGITKLISATEASGTIQHNITSSNAASQSNLILGFPVLASLSGSVILSGSNNILFSAGKLSTANVGYVNGNNNVLTAVPTLSPNSLFQPTMNTNLMFGTVAMTFSTSSVGVPSYNNNFTLTTTTLNHPSGTIAMASNISNGTITSTQNGLTPGTTVATLSNNIIGGGGVTLTHNSSSILTTNSTILGSTTITNNYYHTGSNNSLTFANNLINGLTIAVNGGGSPSTNVSRPIVGNFFGGQTITIQADAVGTDLGGVRNEIVYGYNLIVSGTQAAATTTNQGGAFFGRYNDITNGLADTGKTIFAVGTGTSTAARKTAFSIDSGSLVSVSGSLSVNGNSTFTGSLTVTGSTILKNLSATGTPLIISSSNTVDYYAVKLNGGGLFISSSDYGTSLVAGTDLLGTYQLSGGGFSTADATNNEYVSLQKAGLEAGWNNTSAVNVWTNNPDNYGLTNVTGTSGSGTVIAGTDTADNYVGLVQFQNKGNWTNGTTTFLTPIALTPQGAPSSPASGSLYFSSADSHFYGWNGVAWKQLDNTI